jgi:aminomethyltransferase
MIMELKTPLYDLHVAAGGRMVPFAGYLLPVQYETGVIQEHMAVRQKMGLFDVSHMGEVRFEGPDALKNLNALMTNDFSGMGIGQVRYSPMLNEAGGILDDLIVYRLGEEKYMVVVNAANRAKDVLWMKEHRFGDCAVSDASDDIAQLALQGPGAKALIAELTPAEQIPQKYYWFAERADVGGIDCLLSRTGYTGEFGYELYVHNEDAPALWTMLLEKGKDAGLIPCGLGARDTLRLEAAMPLYGHEMDESVSPLETGLNWAVKAESHDFIGREAMLTKGSPRARVGLKATGKGILREHQGVYRDGLPIGMTTSGTMLPFIGAACAMALVASGSVQPGDAVEVDVRGRMVGAEVVPLPFYNVKR